MILSLDTETEPFGPGRQAPPLVVVAASDGETARLWHHTEAEPALRQLLSVPMPIVGHNIAYDFAVIAAEYPGLLTDVFAAYDVGRVRDTGIRQKLLDLAAGSLGWGEVNGKTTRLRYSLAELAGRHLGIELPKKDTWRLRYAELRDVPLDRWPAEAREYAEGDALATWAVYAAQGGPVRDEGRQTYSEFWIQLMSVWGMRVDAAAVAAFERMARENYARLSAVLVQAGLKRADRRKRNGEIEEGARDTKAAMARIVRAYEAKGAAVPMTSGTDKTPPRPCLDEDACKRSGDPLLATYADFASASKVLRSDVKMLREHGNPIHAHFEVLLETGDIGCSAPNMVNLPTAPGLRECFVPRPGFLLLAVDFAAIQLRTWAQACINLLGFSDMAEVLNAGECPHTMIAADILGIPYEEAKLRPNKINKPNTIYYERQCGKVGNFGRAGGMGAARLQHAAYNQYGVEISESQAREIIRRWSSRWREGPRYLDLISRLTSGAPIQIEQFYSGRLRGGLTYNDAANGIFSALSYDALKDAGWLVAKACYLPALESPLYGSRIVNAIHDELLIEVPEEHAHECAEEASRLMCEGARKWIPDVPPKVEAALMRRWSKKAGPAHDASGRLIPWEDAA